MKNYYKILGVLQEVSNEVIETAIDKRYNQWRQLVSHHDPKVVNEANQALQILEDIRMTLLDKDNRNKYDKTLASSEKIGGLGDPEVMLKEMMTGGKRLSSQTLMKNEERIDAWTCDGCEKVNPIGTQYCQECGKKIALPCPSCQTLSPIAKEFCPECGVNKEKIFDEHKNDFIKKLNDQISRIKNETNNFETGNYPEDIKQNNKKSIIYLISSITLAIGAIFFYYKENILISWFLVLPFGWLFGSFLGHIIFDKKNNTQRLESLKAELSKLENEKKIIHSTQYKEE